MDGVREDLLVPLTGVDPDRLLEHWRWLDNLLWRLKRQWRRLFPE